MQKPLLLKLTNLILPALLLSLAAAAGVLFFQKSYVTGLALALGAALLYLSLRWSDYAKFTLIMLCLFIYLAAYLTNVLLIFLEPKFDPAIEQRLQAARKLGIPYDTRTPLQVVADLQAQGLDAVPMLTPFDLVLTGKSLPAPGGLLLPLAGISRKTTVLCNECGDYAIYQADARGFNNPGIWPQAPIDILVVGDSFSHGACIPDGGDLGSLLRQRGKKVLNLGYSGNGPLLELAALREFAPALKPKVVLWIYYEGNDLTDLAKERTSPFLTRYLQDDSYSQDLSHRQAAIDRAWTGHLETSQVHARVENKPWYYRFGWLLEFLRSFQLRQLKQTIRKAHASLQEYFYQEQVHAFKQVLEKAQSVVRSWGGTLYFVYLPSYYRYSGKARAYPLNQRQRIIATVQSLGIPLIDFHSTLHRLPDPLGAFPFRTNGHYTPKGYQMLVRQINKALEAPPSTGVASSSGSRGLLREKND